MVAKSRNTTTNRSSSLTLTSSFTRQMILLLLVIRLRRCTSFTSRSSRCVLALPNISYRGGHRLNSTTPQKDHCKHHRGKKPFLPRQIARIYTDYASQLWRETSPDARRLIAYKRFANSLRQVQRLVEIERNLDHSNLPSEERMELVEACDTVIRSMERAQIEISKVAFEKSQGVNGDNEEMILDVEGNASRSVRFGVLMGLVVACWVFSGNYIFTGLFTLMTILGQLEYYRAIINTGVYPARRISVLGASSMFLTALFTPDLHQLCLPMSGLWAMVWFLTMKRTVTTIPEIATTFTGMFYLGYVPSFWVRTRMIGMGLGREKTRLAPIMAPALRYLEAKGKHLPAFIPNSIHLPITTGAIFIFWTWLCLAFADVGAYFVGRKYGKTKLGVIAPAAGATSPNKTLEGVLGGCAISASLGILGAWIQKWPAPAFTGALHGTVLALLGLLGDLTASMLKRDAGVKDFGDLLPGHGGILDRVDSFIWSAPYSWLVCGYVLPFLKQNLG